MAEDLKHLIDAIQKDAVEKAEARAERILNDAKQKARQLVQEAETRAREILAQADQDAKTFTERSTKELEQAGRDVLISVARGIEQMLRELVGESIKESLSPDVLKEILVRIGKTYFEENLGGKPSDLYLSENDGNVLAGFFREQLRHMLQEGLVVHTSDRVSKGFRVVLRDQRFYHDFTDEAITDEICRFLQPRVETILRGTIRSTIGGEEDK